VSLAASWARRAERGSRGALHFMLWMYRRLGRSLLFFWFLTPAAVYFLLTDARARRGSLQYLRRLYAWPEGRAGFPREPGLRESLRHLREFSISVVDRLCAWPEEADRIEFRDTGSEHLFRLARQRRGALLLGAHLGNFDMLRILSERQKFKVNVLMYSRHVARISAFLESVQPDARLRVIEMDPGSIRAVFEIKACIDRGEFVGILADRVGPREHARVATASFLGSPASFPLGPFLLGGLLGCPVLLSLCLRTGDACYETVVQPLSEGELVPRGKRDQRARELLDAYVRSLEQACCRAPLQWFNLYDFWETAADPADRESPKRTSRPTLVSPRSSSSARS
jgi:predicted LPLAT superfamily acyltransferase